MPLRLLIENEKQLPDGGPVSYALTVKGAVEIGRAQYLDWVLPDPSKVVSNKHCEIRWKEDGYWLTDTSTNGTFLNGGEDPLRGRSVRLKQGDRIGIGHYIVAVSLDEVEPPAPRPGALPRAVGLGDLWADAPAAPPIDPKLLRPREKEPWNRDFLNRVADLPRIEPTPLPDAAPPAVDWAAPASGRPSAGDDWLPRQDRDPLPGSAEPAPRALEASVVEAGPTPSAVPAPVAPPPASRDHDETLERLARGLGLRENAFAGRDPGAVAEEIGQLVRAIATSLKALLDDRQQAKRVFRVSNHTTIAAFENNPLKFQPTVEHALAVMFGPPSEHYLDAKASLDEAFKDLATHQLQTFSAMQRAVQLLEAEVAPAAIEASIVGEKGLAAMVGWTHHARCWDAYVHRWNDRTKYQGDGLSGAFMRDFARFYDEMQKETS